MINEFLIDIRN